MPKIEKATKGELIKMVEDFTEQIDLRSARLRVLEERMARSSLMVEEIDRLIVRMNGPSSPYRDELEAIVNEHATWMLRTHGSGLMEGGEN